MSRPYSNDPGAGPLVRDLVRVRQARPWATDGTIEAAAEQVRQWLPTPVSFDGFSLLDYDPTPARLQRVPFGQAVLGRRPSAKATATAVRGLLTYDDVTEFTRVNLLVIDSDSWGRAMDNLDVDAADVRRRAGLVVVDGVHEFIAQHLLGMTPLGRIQDGLVEFGAVAWPPAERRDWKLRQPWAD